jgi:OOP family OmpA-OmpF porin
MKTITHALLAVSLLAGAAAHAQGLSIGGSIGSSRYKGDDVGGLRTDRSDTGGKIYGGWEFTPNFGLELGYAQLGTFGSAAGDAEIDGAFVDAVGKWPLGNDFSVLGRLGVFNGKYEDPLGSERGTNLKVGAGVQYDFSPNVALRGEWERYRFDTNGDSRANTDLYSVGLNYTF